MIGTYLLDLAIGLGLVYAGSIGAGVALAALDDAYQKGYVDAVMARFRRVLGWPERREPSVDSRVWSASVVARIERETGRASSRSSDVWPDLADGTSADDRERSDRESPYDPLP
ncbi:MAG: hypothetical protein AAF845_05620 [Bacteroidota bacterium]